MKNLSNTPSRMLDDAIDDLEKAELDPNIGIYMGAWMCGKRAFGVLNLTTEPEHPVKCLVCLAGSTLLGSKEFKRLSLLHEPVSFDTLPEKVRMKFCALDNFRIGYVGEGLGNLRIKRPKGLSECYSIPEYEYDSDKFKKKLRWLANRMRECGV